MSGVDAHAVIVAGGAGSRLAASAPAVTPQKPLLTGADGARLIDRVLAATTRCSTRVVVAGAMGLPSDVIRVREAPPMSGPAAAIVAGVRALHRAGARPADPVLLLAADLVDPAPAVDRLLDALSDDGASGADGVIGVADGRCQPLLSAVRYGRVYDRCCAGGDGGEDFSGASVMSLLRRLTLVEVGLDSAVDVDTWEEAVRYGFGSDMD